MNNDDLKEEIKNRIKLSEIISKKVILKKKSENSFIGLCPFHSEKTPSFHVHDEKQFYHCFGCEKHGDIFSFTMEVDNIDFYSALKYLASLIGLTLNNKSHQNISFQNKYKTLDLSSKFFIETLNNKKNKKVLDYLNKRGLNKEICQEFLIGFAPSKNYDSQLIDFLKSKNINEEELIEIGLAKKKYNNLYGYFYDRIMIPIVSTNGKIIAFGGRSTNSSEPKYLNSPESDVFSKRNILFGAYNVKKSKQNIDNIILCEGYMDVIALFRFGYPAVATLGTAVSEKQIDLLTKLSKNIFIVFDGDQAGKNASIRLFDKLLPLIKTDNVFRFVFLPNNLDPEEFLIKNGKDKFNVLLEKSYFISDIIWLMGIKNKMNDTPEEIAKFWKFIRSKIYQIKEKNLQLAIRDDLENRINKLRSKIRGYNSKPNNFINLNLPKIENDYRFKVIIAIILNFPKLFDVFEKKLIKIKFTNNSLHEVKEVIFSMIKDNSDVSYTQLVETLKERDLIKFLGDFRLEAIFSKLRSSDKKVEIDESRKVLEELIYMVNNN
ncbi:MAG: DNA primase [Alphaproteobacteria bacterium]|nr:MAG: DNA primase [Alphaproteobacteria bacterium]